MGNAAASRALEAARTADGKRLQPRATILIASVRKEVSVKRERSEEGSGLGYWYRLIGGRIAA
jgi:hypothetical protein